MINFPLRIVAIPLQAPYRFVLAEISGPDRTESGRTVHLAGRIAPAVGARPNSRYRKSLCEMD